MMAYKKEVKFKKATEELYTETTILKWYCILGRRKPYRVVDEL